MPFEFVITAVGLWYELGLGVGVGDGEVVGVGDGEVVGVVEGVGVGELVGVGDGEVAGPYCALIAVTPEISVAVIRVPTVSGAWR